MGFDFENMFGKQVFSDAVMRRKLPKHAYESLKRTGRLGLPLDPELAEVVAWAMKEWALEQGATHYTHWFQPMTNVTAGKHDSFLGFTSDGAVLTEFSGKSLVQGEPDASSFPNGGLRSTFEARGYTSWDPTSCAFVRDGTLYIPTAFCSYTGEALDKKTPLLRSMQALSVQALRLLRLFGNDQVRRVTPTVGAEQEYFLIDRELYEQRLDLKICGRTLFGSRPLKGQELDDHYLGRIRIRVSQFMQRLDEELWSLGVAAKTKHNEAAPAQHELAPIFESANVACDHNQLIMETMRVVAKKQGLACLLHEKPFSCVNGSGKHVNWSLTTDDGTNLMEPGKTPAENTRFLLFLCAVIRAVDKHAALLRMSAACIGNDHRLGGFEAPPPILSVYLGEMLTDILEGIAEGCSRSPLGGGELHTGVETLPRLPKDDSDRNRTSPFAFTGNKFEFRMVGSSVSIADALFVLNTIVAESLDSFANRLQLADNREEEARAIIADTMKRHGRVIFNGNNYGPEWIEEAARRGLPCIRSTVESFAACVDPESMLLFERYGVFTPHECQARYDIKIENYIKILCIEASTMLEMVSRQILPACIRYLSELTGAKNNLRAAGVECKTVNAMAQELAMLVDRIAKDADSLRELLCGVRGRPYNYDAALACSSVLASAMETLREGCDRAESLLDEKYWPMPGYTELLHKM